MGESRLETQFRIQLLADKLPPWEREYQFCERRWRFDFAWPDQMVAVEIEGGIYSGGRHVRPTGFHKDAEKYAEAIVLGWRVLRCPGEWVKNGKAIQYTKRLLSIE